MSHTEVVIFDLDGTLVDSEAGIRGCISDTLAHLGVPGGREELSLQQLMAPLPSILAGALIPGDRRDQQVAEGLRFYRARYAAHYLPQARLFSGVTDLLERLKESGLACAVATNKRSEGAHHLIAQCGIAGYFRAVVGEDDVRSPKPDPEMVDVALRRMGLARARVLFIGDSPLDIACGKGAGAYTCGVTYGFTPRDVLASAGAEMFADSPADILAAVAAWRDRMQGL